MALLDDITKKASQLTEEALDKTQELAEHTRRKLQIKNLEHQRDEIYRELGEYYFQLLENQNSVDEEVAEMRNRIYNLNVEIEECKENMDND